LLQFLIDAGRPVCPRLLRVQPLPVGDRLPRDVPVDQLLLLLAEIEADATSPNSNVRRMAIMDRAWFSVMVYSGLRVGEIRRLKQAELDLKERKLRVEQSKGLKDRVVPLAARAVEALAAYLAVRGPAPTDHVFIYRHGPLSTTYCGRRLKTYGQRCGVRITPHQLRHTAATLLLNAGAPLLTVKEVLGHERLETTLVYTRLYEPTVASHYYLAMAQIEGRMGQREAGSTPDPGLMLALVDSLHAGTLNEAQREAARALRTGILALVEQDVDVV